MKAMEYGSKENVFVLLFGGGLGMFKFLDVYFADSYWLALMKAGFTAAMCGFCALAGKYLFYYLKDRYLKYKNKKQINGNN
jgi:hypothetical protein